MSDKLIQYSDALRDFVKIHKQIMAKKQKDILEGNTLMCLPCGMNSLE